MEATEYSDDGVIWVVTNNVALKEPEETIKKIKYSAKLLDPYAVMLR